MMSDGSGTVFICGFPSSGTDLLKNVLNAHGEIYIGGEFPLLPGLADRHDGSNVNSDVEAVVSDIRNCDIYANLQNSNLPEEFAGSARFADLYRALLTSDDPSWYGNKTPQNAEHVDKLERLFPGSRYVLIVRDIRDVALSWKNKWGKDPLLCAHKWTGRMALAMRLLNSVAKDRYLVVKYEELLDDHRAIAARICEFLSLPYDDRIDAFHEHVQDVVPGKLNYGRPVLPANKEKWRVQFDAATVRRIEEIAFDSLRAFGYELTHAKQAEPIKATEKILGIVREATAIMFVGNRAQKDRPKGRLWRQTRLELAKRIGRYRV